MPHLLAATSSRSNLVELVHHVAGVDGRLAGESGVGALARLADGPAVDEDFARHEFDDAGLVALDGETVTRVEGVVMDFHEYGVRAEVVLRHDAEVHLADGG